MFEKLIHHKYFTLYFFTLHFLIWSAFYLLIDVPADMADHWVWSFQLSFGYYEHPPMIAYLMKLVPQINGSYVLSLKIFAIIISMLVLWTAYLICLNIFDLFTARVYLLILESTIYFSLGSVFLHIDQPFLLFWLLSTFSFLRFLQTGQKRYLLLVGVFAGFGALSKYIMLLFYFALFLFCLYNKKYRSLLYSPYFYLMGLISLLLFSPVIYWNYENDWVSFERNLSKGTSGQSYFAENFLPFTLGHLILFSPIFSLISYYLLFKKKLKKIVDQHLKHCFYFLIFIPIIFFTLFSLFGTISDPNWLNISYLLLFMLTASYIYHSSNRLKKRFLMLASISWLLTIIFIIIFMYLIYSPKERSNYLNNRTFDLVKWDETAKIIEEKIEQHSMKYPKFIISREYLIASKLTLYMRDNPLSHTIEREERNLWSRPSEIEKNGALLVCPPKECADTIQAAQNRFTRNQIDYVDQAETYFQGFKIRDYQLYWLKPL